MNWFRSVLQENNNRNTSQSQNWLPDSPSSFWICAGFSLSLCVRYLQLLFFAWCSLFSQTSYDSLYYLFLSSKVSSFTYLIMVWIYTKLKWGHKAAMWGAQRRVDFGVLVHLAAQIPWLGLSHWGGSTEQQLCFKDPRSGREWRCTFPDGFAGIGLGPGWFNEQWHICLCWNVSHQRKKRGLFFSHPYQKLWFFSRSSKILQKLQITLFFFIHLNFIYCFGALRGFLPSDSRYHKSAVFVWNDLLRISCVIVRFCGLWLFMPGWFSRDEQV